MRGANEETYFGGWRRADALGLAPHVDAFAAPGARVGAARVERLGLEAVTLGLAADVDAVAVLTTRVGAARVDRRRGRLNRARPHRRVSLKLPQFTPTKCGGARRERERGKRIQEEAGHGE